MARNASHQLKVRAIRLCLFSLYQPTGHELVCVRDASRVEQTHGIPKELRQNLWPSPLAIESEARNNRTGQQNSRENDQDPRVELKLPRIHVNTF